MATFYREKGGTARHRHRWLLRPLRSIRSRFIICCHSPAPSLPCFCCPAPRPSTLCPELQRRRPATHACRRPDCGSSLCDARPQRAAVLAAPICFPASGRPNDMQVDWRCRFSKLSPCHKEFVEPCKLSPCQRATAQGMHELKHSGRSSSQ
ncbi:hypothetical protein EJB05_01536 [Eragrostis curvula]|uniref:Uncharacterized protein n=1 Tax=Eragrostis curvula TaxID=38414 RepID=A0A5J9WQK9_9POAL|nr:hypothetical protein EJB05_01536 [Eragrostis curvula]